MKAIDQLKSSSIWDKRFDLPTCPKLNNPWLYMAYADSVCRIEDGSQIDRKKIIAHFKKCEVKGKPGLFYRWPGPVTGSQTSHDEIIGAAYFDPWIAQRILAYLEAHGGDFNPLGLKPDKPMRFNVYRMPFLKPYLEVCAGNKMSKCAVSIFSAFITADALKFSPNDHGGRLRNWLMFQKVWHASRLCRIMIRRWRGKMKDKGVTLNGCLSIEPKEYPIISKLAGSEFQVYGS